MGKQLRGAGMTVRKLWPIVPLVLVVSAVADHASTPLRAQAPQQPAAGGAQPAARGRGQQQPLPEGYMERGFRPAPNAAPGMRVTDLGKGGRTFRVNFSRGDDILSGLVEFAQKYKIKNGHFSGLGALDKGMFGWTDTERGNGQKKIPLTEQAEVVSVVGSITTNAQGVATVHAHGAVALQDGRVIGGHWFEAHVGIIAEIFVTEEEDVPQPTK